MKLLKIVVAAASIGGVPFAGFGIVTVVAVLLVAALVADDPQLRADCWARCFGVVSLTRNPGKGLLGLP